MTTPKAILIGLALIASAIFLRAEPQQAQAAIGSPEYAIKATQGLAAWRLRVSTGEVSFCIHASRKEQTKTNPSYYCEPWIGR